MGEHIVCETEKVIFDSKGDAMAFAQGIMRRKGKKQHMEAYRCGSCGYFHLTSTTKSQVTERSAMYKESRERKYNKYKNLDYKKKK